MKQIKRYVSILLACMCLLTSSALAATNASDQIVSYFIDAGPMGNGRIGIDISITARAAMEEIGGENIYVYEVSGTNMIPKAHYTKEYPNMMSEDSWVHTKTLYFYGEAGKTYYISVTVFAKDYNGGADSRTKSFTVTAT